MSRMRSLLFALVLAALTSLALTSLSGANHFQGDLRIGTVNHGANELTYLDCFLDAPCVFLQADFPGENAYAIRGLHAASTGTGAGVLGDTQSVEAGATGIRGRHFAVSGGGVGVRGETLSGSEDALGVLGTSPQGIGVFGFHSGAGNPNRTLPGVRGRTAATASFLATGVEGLVGNPLSSSQLTVLAREPAGVRGMNGTGGSGGIGVFGLRAGSGIGVRGEAAAGNGVEGYSHGTFGGSSFGGIGVRGITRTGGIEAAGVEGKADSLTATGVRGIAKRGVGVQGESTDTGGIGVVGRGRPLAGRFVGNVEVLGTLTKTLSTFRIDHPLAPRRKYLVHGAVESPDMKNVYDGIALTDARGFAVVKLPTYFQALNRSFRYQLTTVGRPSWGADVGIWEEIAKNRFTIRTSRPHVRVSWQVTGIRKDRYANAHRFQVEQNKPGMSRSGQGTTP